MSLTDEQQRGAETVSVRRDALERIREALELAYSKHRSNLVGDVIFGALLEVQHALKR